MSLSEFLTESNLDEEKLIGWRGEVQRDDGGDSQRHDSVSAIHQDGGGNGGKLASVVGYNYCVIPAPHAMQCHASATAK